MPLIPIWVLNREYGRLPRFLRKYVVSRTNSVVYVDEYNVEKPIIDFVCAGRYYQHNTTITLNFSGMAVPRNLRMMRIKNNGVTELKSEKKANNTVVMRIDTIRTETIRITW
jgi:hypothetical protein